MIARATHASFVTVRLLSRNEGEERGKSLKEYEISYRQLAIVKCQEDSQLHANLTSCHGSTSLAS